MIATLVGAGADVGASAQAQELQLVGGANHFCVLDAEGAKCWGGARRGLPRVGVPGGPCLQRPESDECRRDDALIAPRFQRFNDPLRIWANGENTCVEDLQGLSCFGRLVTPEDGARIKAPLGLALGDTHLCALMPDERAFRCYDIDGRFTEDHGRGSYIPELGGDAGGELRPELMTAGVLSTCTTLDRAIQCYATWEVANRGPRFAVGASAVAVNGIDICWLAPASRCEGGGSASTLSCDHLLDPQNGGFTTFTVCSEALDRPTRVVMGLTRTCVLDVDGVACIDRAHNSDGFPRDLQRVEELGHPTQIAMADEQVCGVQGADLRCVDLTTGTLAPPPIQPTDLAIFNFRLEELDGAFGRLTEYLYADKAALFAGLAGVAAAFPMAQGVEATRARLMLLNVVRPVLESTTTAFFVRSVLPVYQRRVAAYNQSENIQGLADFGASAATIRVAFEALRWGLTTTRGAVVGTDQAALLDAALSACGRVLAQGATADAAREALPALTAAEPLFTALASGTQASGQGLMMASLLGFLQAVL